MLKAPPKHNFGIQTITKCGEIFCHNFTEFTFCCTLCKVETFSLENYLNHVKYFHFSNESCKSNEVQEFNDIDSIPKSICNLKDNENNTTDGLAQSDNNNPANNYENLLEYSEDINDKELSKFEAEEQELNYIDNFLNVKYNLKDQEKNVCDSIEPSCNDNSDNKYVNELDHVKDFSDKIVCYDSTIIEISCSEDGNSVDCYNSDSNEFPDNESSCHTNSSEAFNENAESLNQSSTKSKTLLHKCSECQEPFFSNNDMIQHVLKVHHGFKCPECYKRFILRSRLAIHLKSHSNVKNIICPIENCGMRFLTVEHLKCHIVEHDTEYKFICVYENCGRAFTTKRRLRIHKNTHKGNRFICELCGVGAKSRQKLDSHRRTHTGEKPFHCEVCNKHFVRKDTLNKHMSIHTKIRPHICRICNRGFPFQLNLARHVYVHSNESPFKCKFCGKTFKQPHRMENHERKEHYKQKSKGKNVEVKI